MAYEDYENEEESEDEEEKDESSESSETVANLEQAYNANVGNNTQAPTPTPAPTPANNQPAPAQQPAAPAQTSTLPENSPYGNNGQGANSAAPSQNQGQQQSGKYDNLTDAQIDYLVKNIDQLSEEDKKTVQALSDQRKQAGTQAQTGNNLYNSLYGRTGKEGYGKDSYVYSYSAKQLQNDINKQIIARNKEAVKTGHPENVMSLIKEDGLMGYKTKEAMDKLGMDTSMYSYVNSGSSYTPAPSSSGSSSSDYTHYDSPIGPMMPSGNGSSTSAAPRQSMTGNSMSAALAEAAANARNTIDNRDNPSVQKPGQSNLRRSIPDGGENANAARRQENQYKAQGITDTDDIIAAENQERALSGQSERYDDRYYREQNQGGNDMSANATWDRWYQEDLNSGLTPDEVIERARAEGSYEGDEYARYIEGLQMMEKFGIGTSSDSSAEAPQPSMLGTGSSPGSFAGVNVRQQSEPTEPAPYTDPNAGVPMSQAGSMSQALANVNQQPEPVTDTTANERYDWRYANEQGNYDMSPDAAFSRWYQQDSQNGLSVDQMIEAARAEGSYEGRQYANWLMSNGSNLQAETSPQEYMAELEQMQNNRGLGGRPARIELPTTEPERESMAGNSMSAALENRQPDRMMPRGYATPANESLAGNSFSAALANGTTPTDTNIFRQELEDLEAEMASDDIQSSGMASTPRQLTRAEGVSQVGDSMSRALADNQAQPTTNIFAQDAPPVISPERENQYKTLFNNEINALSQMYPDASFSQLYDYLNLFYQQNGDTDTEYYRWFNSFL